MPWFPAACRPSRWPCAVPGTWRPTRLASRPLPRTRSCRGRWTRSPPCSPARRRPRVDCRSPCPRHDAARRDPRTARGRARGSSRAPPRSSGRWRNRSARTRSITSSSPRAARAITRRSTRSTCSASGTRCRSGSGRRRSSRCTARSRGSIGRSSSGSASRAPRRTSSRSSRPVDRRARRPWRSPTTRHRRLRGRGDVHRPRRRARSWRSPRRRRTRPSCWRSPRCRPRCPATRPTRRRSSPCPTRWRRRWSSSPRSMSMARDQASADRLLVLARGYEYATAREWALKLKELARVFADPYSAADFEHGPLALLEPGVPVLATVRPGPTLASLVALLRAAAGRPRRRHRGRLRSGRGAGPGPLAVRAARRDARMARADRVDRRRPAPRAAPDARPRAGPGAAAQPQQGDPHALSGPSGDGRHPVPGALRLHPNAGSTTNPALRAGTPFSPRSDDRHYTARHTFTAERRIDASTRGLETTPGRGPGPRSRSAALLGFLVPTIAQDLTPKPEAQARTAESPVARQFIAAYVADDQATLDLPRHPRRGQGQVGARSRPST